MSGGESEISKGPVGDLPAVASGKAKGHSQKSGPPKHVVEDPVRTAASVTGWPEEELRNRLASYNGNIDTLVQDIIDGVHGHSQDNWHKVSAEKKKKEPLGEGRAATGGKLRGRGRGKGIPTGPGGNRAAPGFSNGNAAFNGVKKFPSKQGQIPKGKPISESASSNAPDASADKNFTSAKVDTAVDALAKAAPVATENSVSSSKQVRQGTPQKQGQTKPNNQASSVTQTSSAPVPTTTAPHQKKPLSYAKIATKHEDEEREKEKQRQAAEALVKAKQDKEAAAKAEADKAAAAAASAAAASAAAAAAAASSSAGASASQGAVPSTSSAANPNNPTHGAGRAGAWKGKEQGKTDADSGAKKSAKHENKKKKEADSTISPSNTPFPDAVSTTQNTNQPSPAASSSKPANPPAREPRGKVSVVMPAFADVGDVQVQFGSLNMYPDQSQPIPSSTPSAAVPASAVAPSATALSAVNTAVPPSAIPPATNTVAKSPIQPQTQPVQPQSQQKFGNHAIRNGTAQLGQRGQDIGVSPNNTMRNFGSMQGSAAVAPARGHRGQPNGGVLGGGPGPNVHISSQSPDLSHGPESLMSGHYAAPFDPRLMGVYSGTGHLGDLAVMYGNANSSQGIDVAPLAAGSSLGGVAATQGNLQQVTSSPQQAGQGAQGDASSLAYTPFMPSVYGNVPGVQGVPFAGPFPPYQGTDAFGRVPMYDPAHLPFLPMQDPQGSGPKGLGQQSNQSLPPAGRIPSAGPSHFGDRQGSHSNIALPPSSAVRGGSGSMQNPAGNQADSYKQQQQQQQQHQQHQQQQQQQQQQQPQQQQQQPGTQPPASQFSQYGMYQPYAMPYTTFFGGQQKMYYPNPPYGSFDAAGNGPVHYAPPGIGAPGQYQVSQLGVGSDHAEPSVVGMGSQFAGGSQYQDPGKQHYQSGGPARRGAKPDWNM